MLSRRKAATAAAATTTNSVDINNSISSTTSSNISSSLHPSPLPTANNNNVNNGTDEENNNNVERMQQQQQPETSCKQRRFNTTGSSAFVLMMIRRLCRCWWGCTIFCVLLLFLFLFILHHGHHATCLFHKALCTPFSQYLVRFPMLPSPKRQTKSRQQQQQQLQSCDRFESFLQEHHYPYFTNSIHDTNHHHHRKKKLLLLIGESRGGSTYTYDTLNLHSSITMIGQEALFKFSNTICNNNIDLLLLRNHDKCTFENWLTALYENSFDKISVRNGRPLPAAAPAPAMPSTSQEEQGQPTNYHYHLFGTKINIEQIPPEFYHDLTLFLSCISDSVVVLHVSRASTIASFWNYQIEVKERIYENNWKFTSEVVPQALENDMQQLELDPILAADWVHQRDALSQELFRLLAFGGGGISGRNGIRRPIRYQRVYYEHLKDDELLMLGEDSYHWRSVFAFLGVDVSKSIQELRLDYSAARKKKSGQKGVSDLLRTHNKTHSKGMCQDRISNWPAVKEALGSDSLSVLACENYS